MFNKALRLIVYLKVFLPKMVVSTSLSTITAFAFHCSCYWILCFNPVFLLLSCLLSSSPCFLFPCIWVLVVCTQQYLLLQSPLMFTDQAQQDVIMVLKFPSNSPVTHVAANTQPGLATPAVISVTANRLFAVNKWHNLPGKWIKVRSLRNHCHQAVLLLSVSKFAVELF